MTETTGAIERLEAASQRLDALRRSVATGIVGQTELIDGLLIALAANGHALIEGVPGLAKTRAVNLLSRACLTSFARVQFTPDLLPADIVGTQVYNRGTGAFENRPGPLFANLILADEINRAAPKVQSALLEAMQERQVTIGGETMPLPRPFHVFATQNPIEQEGTYPLPEAQVDRFLLKLVVTYPSVEEEREITRMVMQEVALPEIEPVVDAADIVALQAATREVYVDPRIVAYGTDLVFATRFPERFGLGFGDAVDLGASPRASIALVQAGRARALLAGRDGVTPEDIQAIAPAVLRHRLLLSYRAEAEGMTADGLVAAILAAVEVP